MGFTKKDLTRMLGLGACKCPNMALEICLCPYSIATFADHMRMSEEALAACFAGREDFTWEEAAACGRLLGEVGGCRRRPDYLLWGRPAFYDLAKRAHRRKPLCALERYRRSAAGLGGNDAVLRALEPTFDVQRRKYVLRAEVNHLLDAVGLAEWRAAG